MKHSPNLRSTGRAGLAVSAAALLTFGLAAPAAAEPVETYEGAVRAQYVDNHQSGDTVTMSGDRIGTNLFRLRLEDGSELISYCIDIETGIRSNAWYKEDSWANYPGKGSFSEPGKVHWILQQGYPSVSAQELAEASDANAARVTESEALAATQAAIWHYSNGATLDRGPGNVKAIYDYLVDNAEELPQEPAPTLSVTPGSAAGKAGETVGEFVISTNAESVPVDLTAPEGVELVDLASGQPVGETLSDGDKVGFSVPADSDAGQASFSLEANATIKQGRLFKGEDPNKATQTLITAEDSDVTVNAAASAEWSEADQPTPTPEPSEEPSTSPEPTPEPTDEPEPKPTPSESPSEDDKPAPGKEDDKPTLPVTGGALLGLVAAGVAALGAGGGALYLSRKRRSNGADADTDA
ncbi:Cys-Gln thioester bond-forming surface protein [Nocardiopsis sp. NPDC058789]|uniref:Cys-Gln thioester bond-forming surface protein n=1 Tax=Nocardiopsis TaxID=2013 RepID=UPI00366CA1C3